VLWSRDETADASECLTKRSHDNIGQFGDSKMVSTSSPAFSDHSRRVGVIKQQPSTVLTDNRKNIWQRRNVSIETIDALGNHQNSDAWVSLSNRAQNGIQVIGIRMSKSFPFGACQLHAFQNTVVDLLIKYNEIVRRTECRDGRDVCRLSGWKKDARFSTKKRCEFLFQFVVNDG